MADSPELAAVRARVNEPRFASYGMLDDCRALLWMLDEALAKIEFAATALDVKDRRVDELKAERDAARAEIQRLNMEMTAYREKLTPADAAAMKSVIDALYAEKRQRKMDDPIGYTGIDER